MLSSKFNLWGLICVINQPFIQTVLSMNILHSFSDDVPKVSDNTNKAQSLLALLLSEVYFAYMWTSSCITCEHSLDDFKTAHKCEYEHEYLSIHICLHCDWLADCPVHTLPLAQCQYRLQHHRHPPLQRISRLISES